VYRPINILNDYDYYLTQVDEDGNHYISVNELGRALELVGIKMPGYQVRDLLRQHDVTRDDRLDFNEFKKVSVDTVRWPTSANVQKTHNTTVLSCCVVGF